MEKTGKILLIVFTVIAFALAVTAVVLSFVGYDQVQANPGTDFSNGGVIKGGINMANQPVVNVNNIQSGLSSYQSVTSSTGTGNTLVMKTVTCKEFVTDSLIVTGTLSQTSLTINNYTMPIAPGTSGQVVETSKSDASVLAFVSPNAEGEVTGPAAVVKNGVATFATSTSLAAPPVILSEAGAFSGVSTLNGINANQLGDSLINAVLKSGSPFVSVGTNDTTLTTEGIQTSPVQSFTIGTADSAITTVAPFTWSTADAQVGSAAGFFVSSGYSLTGKSGNVRLSTGNSDTVSGNVMLQTGDGISSGSIYLNTGIETETIAGNVRLASGIAPASGSINLKVGTSSIPTIEKSPRINIFSQEGERAGNIEWKTSKLVMKTDRLAYTSLYQATSIEQTSIVFPPFAKIFIYNAAPNLAATIAPPSSPQCAVVCITNTNLKAGGNGNTVSVTYANAAVLVLKPNDSATFAYNLTNYYLLSNYKAPP